MALPTAVTYETPSTRANATARDKRADLAAVVAGLATDDAKTNFAIARDAGVPEPDIERIVAAQSISAADAALVLSGLTTAYDLNNLPDRAQADAGADVAAATGEVGVALDGSGSVAGEGSLTYAWTQTAGETVALSNAAVAAPTFTAPATAQTLTFRLVVSDDLTTSRPDTVDVVVTAA